jgi:hypothetical protein
MTLSSVSTTWLKSSLITQQYPKVLFSSQKLVLIFTILNILFFLVPVLSGEMVPHYFAFLRLSAFRSVRKVLFIGVRIFVRKHTL